MDLLNSKPTVNKHKFRPCDIDDKPYYNNGEELELDKFDENETYLHSNVDFDTSYENFKAVNPSAVVNNLELTIDPGYDTIYLSMCFPQSLLVLRLNLH